MAELFTSTYLDSVQRRSSVLVKVRGGGVDCKKEKRKKRKTNLLVPFIYTKIKKG